MLKQLLLLRTRKTGETPTLGRLLVKETMQELCLTLEEPWRDADRDGLGDTNVSCVPAGTFRGSVVMSPKRKRLVPELTGVPGRKNIQLHIGNTLNDTEGCILVGLSRSKNGAFIERSTDAFNKLMAYLDGQAFTLEVVDPPAGVA